MQIGQYQILERIAVGGMAEVFRGRVAGVEGFEKTVAIKRILPELARDERFVEMLLKEARIHAGLSHRNIVQIHDLGQSDEGEYFIVLEFVEGRDLRALLDALAARRARLPDALALYVAEELAHGLHFAHDLRGPDGELLGLIHRDVSPSNVLVSYSGEVKLSDFGLARRRQDRSVVGSLKGKLAYMSPEQARRDPLDRRTDVFALGAVLYEMLTGYHLRTISDEVQGWREVAAGELPDLRRHRPDLGEPLVRLLERALASDPSRRFPDAAALAAALHDALLRGTEVAGAAELAALVRANLPPGAPRKDAERSKVIRLASGVFGRTGPPPVPRPVSPRSTTPARPLPPPRRVSPPPGAPAPAGLPPVASSLALPRAQADAVSAFPSPPSMDSQTLVVARPRRRGLALWIATFLVALVVAAAGVHILVMPLDVAAAWSRPAWLVIASEPPGADVWLDGRRLGSQTPVRLPIARDRRDHAVEITRPGFRRVRDTVRLDQSVSPSLLVPLVAEIRAAIEPLPGPAVAPLAADAGDAARD